MTDAQVPAAWRHAELEIAEVLHLDRVVVLLTVRTLEFELNSAGRRPIDFAPMTLNEEVVCHV